MQCHRPNAIFVKLEQLAKSFAVALSASFDQPLFGSDFIHRSSASHGFLFVAFNRVRRLDETGIGFLPFFSKVFWEGEKAKIIHSPLFIAH
jgi:hypothetical protein